MKLIKTLQNVKLSANVNQVFSDFQVVVWSSMLVFTVLCPQFLHFWCVPPCKNCVQQRIANKNDICKLCNFSI